MRRHFHARSSIGPSLPSTTGFAEGCALSCAAMLIADFVCAAWIRQSCPVARPLSHVDNREVVTRAGEATLQAAAAVQTFADELQLTLDKAKAKTYLWSTDAAERSHFRQAGYPVELAARDLGGHLQYSRHRGNSTITARIKSVAPLWAKLKRSRANTAAKLRALRVAVWPRALHGISGGKRRGPSLR